MEEENDFFAGVMKIALGIFIGAMLIWAVVELRARYEISQFNKAAVAELNRQAEIAREHYSQRARQQEAQRNEQAARVARTRERQAAQIAAERSKERAWTAFFRPSEQCLNTASVECGNAYIRARREFERKYAAGEL